MAEEIELNELQLKKQKVLIEKFDMLPEDAYTIAISEDHKSALRERKIKQKDILYAWRDFECSFFAGALLCPKIPFRRFANRNSHNISSCNKIGITPSVYMRRLPATSSYKYWHYFDIYPPGYLRAVYRGNGIPMPWGNMRLVTDPCRQWGGFRLLSNLQIKKPIPQLSLLKENNITKLYCSLSLKTNDAAGNPHVICSGVELNKAIDSGLVEYDVVDSYKSLIKLVS